MKKQKGFFILESIIAIIVFVIGVVGVLEVQKRSVENTSDSQYRAQAYHMANNLINLISMDYGNISNYSSTSSACSKADLTNTNCSEFARWKSSLEGSIPNSQVELSFDGTTKIINVTIKWKNKSSDQESQYSISSHVF